jgi:transcriptional regulator with XRE-family HTH domain
MRKLEPLHARIGARVRRLREANEWTREYLAERAELSLGYVARLELGRSQGTLGTWDQLARALGTTLSELCREESTRPRSAREGRRQYGASERLEVLQHHAQELGSEALSVLIKVAHELADQARRSRS